MRLDYLYEREHNYFEFILYKLTNNEYSFLFLGEKEANKQACMMILAKVVEDPQSGTCLNVSYADVSGPVANYNPTGSPYAQNTSSAFNASTTSLNSGLSSVSQSLMLNGGLNLSLNLNAPGQNMGTITAQLLDSIKVSFFFLWYYLNYIFLRRAFLITVNFTKFWIYGITNG